MRHDRNWTHLARNSDCNMVITLLRSPESYYTEVRTELFRCSGRQKCKILQPSLLNKGVGFHTEWTEAQPPGSHCCTCSENLHGRSEETVLCSTVMEAAAMAQSHRALSCPIKYCQEGHRLCKSFPVTGSCPGPCPRNRYSLMEVHGQILC